MMAPWSPLELLWGSICYWLLTLSAGSPLEPMVCAGLLSSMLLMWRLYNALRPDPQLFVACVVIGPLIDLSLMLLDLVAYVSHRDWLLPLWIVTLWTCFAGNLSRVLRPLLERAGPWIWLPIAIGPPLAYAGGVRTGAASFGQPAAFSLLAIATGWLLMFALLRFLARRRALASNATH